MPNKGDYPPVGCDHCSIVADIPNPCWSPSGQIGHIRVGVVVDPSLMTTGKDALKPPGQ